MVKLAASPKSNKKRIGGGGGGCSGASKLLSANQRIFLVVVLGGLFLLVLDGSSSSFSSTSLSLIETVATQQEEPPTKKHHHHCWNDDFQPQNKVSVWTMLNDNLQYVQGAIKLGRAINTHSANREYDLVVMELRTKPIPEELWNQLRDVGWQRCIVSSIHPPQVALEKTRKDLREKFAVLHIWAMSVYDRIVFVDADTYVRASIDHLFSLDLKGKPIGVTQDIRNRKWVPTFNSGVLLLNPNVTEHYRLVELLDSGIEYEYIMSDQGFLNEVYRDNWYEIGFVNNANLALYRFQRQFWDQFALEDINIIHYTMAKPWNCQSNGPYGPICDVWING